MIPKIIHFCWLSDDSFPASIQKCIDSWKRYLLGYELMLWNYKRFPRGKSKWVDQAFDNHKYAFAADYIRLYALYHYGGIYLDSDVEVLRSFDELLELPYIIGQEKTPFGIEAATLGFPPRSQFIKDLLDRYENRHFVKADGSFDEEPLPRIVRRYIASRYNYHVIASVSDFVYAGDTINVFTPEYFSPKHYASKEIEATPQTFSIHHYAGSWVSHSPIKKELPKTSIKKTTVLGIIRKRLVIRKKINIISTPEVSRIVSNKLNVTQYNPIHLGEMSEIDIVSVIKKTSLLTEDNIVFISSFESKNKEEISDFYPIAKIKNTDIEIHFRDCFSREDVENGWNAICKQIDGLRNVAIIPSNKPITKARLFFIAMMINIGATTISI